MSNTLGVLLTIVLLTLNALFVAAEFALISARRTQLEPRVAEGSWSARMALRAMGQISLVLAAAQLGITLSTLGLGAISEPALAHLMEPVFELVRLRDGLVYPVSFVLATMVVVWCHVVLGEMVPKNLALVVPERAALVLGPFMLATVWVFKPVVVALNALTYAVVRAMRIQPKREVASSFTHDEVAALVEESRREGLLDDDEYGLLSGALGFGAATVERVLIGIADLVTVSSRTTPAEVERACTQTGFSRFPVRGDAGDLVGYLHIKDVLETSEAARSTPIADKWVRPFATLRHTTGLHEALRAMQSRGAHMARVADGSGTVIGVVMLEDVLEELVGEIRDSGSGR